MPDGLVSGGVAHMLERDLEQRAICAAVEHALRGDGGVIVIEGPAGIGKTELLRAAAAAAAAGPPGGGRPRGGRDAEAARRQRRQSSFASNRIRTSAMSGTTYCSSTWSNS